MHTKPLITLLASLALAACGSKSKGTTTPPTDEVPDDTAGHEPVEGRDDDPAPPDPVEVQAALAAAETAAYQNAKPVFDKYCAGCHQQGGKKATAKKLGHFDMTSYPFGGEHAKVIGHEVREALAIGGGTATMPFDKPGAVTGDELALIAAWADSFDAAHPDQPPGDDD